MFLILLKPHLTDLDVKIMVSAYSELKSNKFFVYSIEGMQNLNLKLTLIIHIYMKT